MKRTLILVFLAAVFCVTLFAQRSEYLSKEKDKYYKKLQKKHTPFKPLDKEFILGYKSEYFEKNEKSYFILIFVHN